MVNRPQTGQTGWNSEVTESRLAASATPEEVFGTPRFRLPPAGPAGTAAAPLRLAQAGPLAAAGIAGQSSVSGAESGLVLAQADAGNQGDDDLLFPERGGGGNDAPPAAAAPAAPPSAPPPAAEPQPRASRAPAPAQPEAPAVTARPESSPPAVAASPQQGGGAEGDDLLFPDGGGGGGGDNDTAGAPPADAGGAPADAPAGDPGSVAAAPQGGSGPVISIQSDIDPESWAEYGGWYRQDYGIFYRPVGHKDKFIYSWLILTGPQSTKNDKTPAAAVFTALTAKDAQGSCAKCHSVDEIQGKKRVVNFSPPKVEAKQGRFTNFIHEPHFGIMENRGCLTCHNLEKARPYLKSFEQGNPRSFASNFGTVKKELCQTCHTSEMARQDCLLCHKYHVTNVTMPIMNTKIPKQ
jgi:hypothetical protein